MYRYSCTALKAQNPAASYPATRVGPKPIKANKPSASQSVGSEESAQGGRRALPQMEGCVPDELCEVNTIMHGVLSSYRWVYI